MKKCHFLKYIPNNSFKITLLTHFSTLTSALNSSLSLLDYHQAVPYLNGWWWALLASGRSGQGGGGLDKGGGHLRWHWGGCTCCASTGWHIAHQPHTAVHFDVGMAFGGHVEDFEAIVVKAGELALVGPLPVVSTNGDSGLGVEDCQLPAWCRREGVVYVYVYNSLMQQIAKTYKKISTLWHLARLWSTTLSLQPMGSD